MVKILQCDDCDDIYSPHKGSFGLTPSSENDETLLTLLPARALFHRGAKGNTIDVQPIDLCRPCLVRHAQKIFTAEQAG